MINFKINEAQQLFYLQEMSWVEVEIKSCFPITNDKNFFSILNKDGQELKLVESEDELTQEDMNVLEKYFNFKKYKFVVKGIYSVKEDFGIRHFCVLTQNGERSFQTALDAWPKVFENGDVLITDIYEDQFWVEKLEFGEKYLKALV